MAVGDIGIWIDQDGGVTTSTTFVNLPLEGTGSEDRNDGGYTYNTSTDDVTVADAGNYLAIYHITTSDSSTSRANLRGGLALNGTIIQGSISSGYRRDATNQIASARGYAIVDVSANDEISVQLRRDSDADTGSTTAGLSNLMLVRLMDNAEAAFAHYDFNTSQTLGGTTFADVTISSTIRETDTAVIERTTDNIRLKPTNTNFLIIYGVNANTGTTRTQRITRAAEVDEPIPIPPPEPSTSG